MTVLSSTPSAGADAQTDPAGVSPSAGADGKCTCVISPVDFLSFKVYSGPVTLVLQVKGDNTV